MSNVFETLNNINVNGHTEKKNGLTYLAWAWAWGEVKKAYPDAIYTVYENEIGRPWFDDGRTGWVKTGVTIEGIEHIEYLPVMDFKNKSIPANAITSFDANKTVQRSLTKACARHGLGLYIYAGEDLPEADKPKDSPEPERKAPQDEAKEKATLLKWFGDNVTPENYLKIANAYGRKSINDMTAEQLAHYKSKWEANRARQAEAN